MEVKLHAFFFLALGSLTSGSFTPEQRVTCTVPFGQETGARQLQSEGYADGKLTLSSTGNLTAIPRSSFPKISRHTD